MTAEPPVLRVVRGQPTEEELAAVVLVLAASAAPGSAGSGPARSGWSAYWRSVGAPAPRGPNAWALSAR